MKKVALKGLRKKIYSRRIELIVSIAFFLLSLRVINWFEYPYIVISGDLRPPLLCEAFLKRVFNTWDEIDFGLPSVYLPRILDPFYLFIVFFHSLGIDLCISQILSVFLIYFLSSILMYIFVNQLTNGDVVASFVAAIYLTSNVYLINDREVTAIGFIDLTLLILPSLIIFLKGLRAKSYKLMVISGILCILTYATFPNYRATLICLIMVGLFLLFFLLGKGLEVKSYKEKASCITLKVSLDVSSLFCYLKLLITFGISFLLASFWIFMIVFSNFDVLSAAYAKISSPWFIGGLKLYDIIRLIARWGFYSGALGKPYVPYSNIYLHNPFFIFLCYLPAMLAFSSLLISKNKKITIFFGSIAVASLLLASGFSFSEYGNRLYLAILGIPLLKVFREASNWIFFVVISFAILIGYTISALCHIFRNKSSQLLIISLTIMLFLVTSYPLTTGEVTKNWLKPDINGSSIPSSYIQLNDMLSNRYWALLLPQRNVYVVYNFTRGPFSCGNPYPLIFSKPVISGIGTEYIQPEKPELIHEIYKLMRTKINYRNIAVDGRASASSVETDGFEPYKAIDGKIQTRWSSQVGVPQWLVIEWNEPRKLSKINVFFESAYSEDFKIETWNGSEWVAQAVVKNNTSTHYEYIFPKPVNTTKVRLYFTKASRFGSISIWEVEIYARTNAVPKFLGMLGIRYIILERNMIFGNTYSIDELKLNGSRNFVLVKKWDEIILFNNTYAVQKIYVADNILNYTTLSDIYEVTESFQWGILRHSAFVNLTLLNKRINGMLTLPRNFVWREVSPTKYEIDVETEGPFVLILLESYDQHWKLFVNGKQISESDHIRVNAFANGWLIKETGKLKIIINYETQNLVTVSSIISLILPFFLLIFLSKRGLRI